MKVYELEVDGRNTIKFSENFLCSTKKVSQLQNVSNQCKIEIKTNGGILRKGEWAWMARGRDMRILSLRNNQTISMYEFSESLGYDENCYIKSIEELFPDDIDNILLGILIESADCKRGGSRSYLCVYSVMSSTVVSTLNLPLRGTCIKFVGSKACRRNILQNFHGCIAIGTVDGVLLLVDLNIRKTMPTVDELQLNTFVPCQIMDCNMPFTEIHRTFRTCQQDGVHFILKMEVVQKSSKICSILPIDEAMALAIGLEDGRLIYCDLTELEIIYIVAPLPNLKKHSIIRMTYLKECRSIGPCIYLWAIYEHSNNIYVVMYILNYVTWKIDPADIFEPFDKCSIGFQMRLDVASSYISCQALKLKLPFNAESEYHNICAFSWFSHGEEKNNILIFDLTMYYQESNLNGIRTWNNALKPITDNMNSKYLSHYILNGSCKGYDVWLNPDTLTPFVTPKSSYENYVYPNSISFDCYLLHHDGCRRYNWEGAQCQLINILRTSNASIFFDYRKFYDNILQVGLHSSQEILSNREETRKQQYEVILSTALEYNCMGLLRDCAKSWIDGSFMGHSTCATDLSLSTLTDWAWKNFKQLRECCDNLKKTALGSTLNGSNGPVDVYSRCYEKLLFKSRQIKLLAELFQDILVDSKHQIPERVFLQLRQQQQKMNSIADYYNLLLWFLNIGVLPELPAQNGHNAKSAVIYPYIVLRSFYKEQRKHFASIYNNCMIEKTGHCRLLYIDYLLEYQCKIQSNELYNYWYKGKGEPVYPPSSIQSIIDIILVPDIGEDIKYAVLLYFLLDLNMAIDETQYKDVMVNLIKFPSVFKLSPQLIKTVQSFWNLDHGHYVLAVDEFISPFNKDQKYERWQIELLLEVLLTQNASHLALRILETQAHLITPELKLKTLLDNDLISEAFHFVRSKSNRKLLEFFFTACFNRGQFSVIRDLALTDQEGSVLQGVLKTEKFPNSESLHFIYLLQKSKYLEAVTYLDELSKIKTLTSHHSPNNYNEMDAPNLVLSAFNTTLMPVTQNLTDVYFKIKSKIKQKELSNNSPVPFSCQLTKQNANNLLGGIYHSSALSTHFATHYCDYKNNCENTNESNDVKRFMNSNNTPFLRPLQTNSNSMAMTFENIKYPTIYKIPEKRTFTEREMYDFSYDNINSIKSDEENPCKRRRLIDTKILDNSQNNANKIFPVQEEGREAYKPTHITDGKRPEHYDKDFSGNRSMEVHDSLKMTSPNIDMKRSKCDHESIDDSALQLKFSSKQQIIECTHLEEYESQLQETTNKQDIVGEYLEQHKSERCENKSNFNSECNWSVDSDDDYYSPIDSFNTSAVIVDSHKNKIDLSELTKQSLLSGPQPRKPLSRLSVESEESLKSHSKSPQYSLNSSKPVFTSQNDPNEQEEMSTAVELREIDHTKKIDNDDRNYNNVCGVIAKLYPSGLNVESYHSEVYALQSNSPKINSNIKGSDKADNFIPETITTQLNEFAAKLTPSATCETIANVDTTLEVQTSECTTILNSFVSSESITDNTTVMSNKEKSTMEEKEYHVLDTTLSMSTCALSFLKASSMKYSSNEHSTPVGTSNSERLCHDASQVLEHLSDVEDVQVKFQKAAQNERIHDEIDLLYGDLNSPESDGRTSTTSNQSMTHSVGKALVMESTRYIENANEPEKQTEDICIVLSSSSSASSFSTDESLAASMGQEDDNRILLSEENSYSCSKYAGGNYDDDESKTNETFSKDELEESDTATRNDNHDIDCSDDIDVVEIGDSSLESEETNLKDYVNLGERQNVTSDTNDLIEADEIVEISKERDDTEERKNTSMKIEKRLAEKIDDIEKEIDTTKQEVVVETMIHVGKENMENANNMGNVESVMHVEVKAKSVNNQSIVGVVVPGLMPENVQSEILEKEKVDMLSGGKEIITNLGQSKKSKDIFVENAAETNQDKQLFSLQVETDDKDILELVDHKIERVQKYSTEQETEQQKNEENKVKLSLDADHFSKEEQTHIVETDGQKVGGEKESNVANEKFGNNTTITEAKLKNVDMELINKNSTVKNNDSMAIDQMDEQKISLTDKLEQSPNIIHEKKIENLEEFHCAPNKGVDLTIRKRYFLRGFSEPPTELDNNPINSEISQVYSDKRCDSVPPESQVIDVQLTLGIRSRTRANSLGGRGRKGRSTTASPTVSLKSVKGLKRRSNILEPITEDSPSSRTRSRLRLNSIESEVGSVDQQQSKRSRKAVDSTQGTPKRSRRSSDSNTDIVNATSKILRSSSVISLTESEDIESIPPTPTSSNKRHSLLKSKNSADEVSENSEHSPSLRITATDNNLLYSSERRLTRNQRALLQKSRVLAQNFHLDTEISTTPPTPLKKISKARSVRSVATGGRNESDDNDSVSSRQSMSSSIGVTNQRVTRSSLRNKVNNNQNRDEIDDDSYSMSSSVGSDRQFRSVRNKDKKSLNTTLSSIPEDSLDETIHEKRRRGTRDNTKH